MKSWKEKVKENAVDIGYLSDWYQASVTDDPPVWTDEHLNELDGDFYLLPKSVVDEEAENESKDMIAILNDFAKYIKYDPDQKTFNLLSNNFTFHTAGKPIEHLLSKYDPSGVLSVLYARNVFEDAMKGDRISVWKFLNSKEVQNELKRTQEMYQELHSQAVEEALHEYMQDMNRLVEQVSGIKLLENPDPEDKLAEITFIQSITKVTEDMDKCRNDVYLKSGNPVGAITQFHTRILVFDRMADCLLTLSEKLDAIYLCYIRQQDTADGYFAFMIKNNGNLFSINDRIDEHYIGEHQNRRNNRFAESHADKLFPYDFIFQYSDYDYKGYATKYYIDDEKLDFVHLEPQIYQPLLLAMILLKHQWEGQEITQKPVLLNTLLPENFSNEITGTELALYENCTITVSHKEYQPNLDPNKIITGEYNEHFHMNNVGQLWVDLYGDGFQPDFSNLLSSNHLIEDKHAKSVQQKVYAEFIGDTEKMDREVYRKLRIQLAEHITEKMQEEKEKWSNDEITSFMKEKIKAKKQEFIEMVCESYFRKFYLEAKDPYTEEPTRASQIRRIRWEEVSSYGGIILNDLFDTSGYSHRWVEIVYDDSDGKKCAYGATLHFKDWKDIESFVGEPLPKIFQGWQANSRTLGYNGNSILDATDAVGDIIHPLYADFPHDATYVSVYFSKRSWRKVFTDWMIAHSHEDYLEQEKSQKKAEREKQKQMKKDAEEAKKRLLAIPFSETEYAKELKEKEAEYTNVDQLMQCTEELYYIDPELRIGSFGYTTGKDGLKKLNAIDVSVARKGNKKTIEMMESVGWYQLWGSRNGGNMYIRMQKNLKD